MTSNNVDWTIWKIEIRFKKWRHLIWIWKKKKLDFNFWFQEEIESGIGPRFGGRDGHWIRLFGRNGLCLADTFGHRHPAPQHDAHLVPQSDDRLLSHAATRLVQRSLQITARTQTALHHPLVHRHHFRSVCDIWSKNRKTITVCYLYFGGSPRNNNNLRGGFQ